MESDTLESRLLRHVHRAGYKPVKPRVIAEQLKLDEDNCRQLKRLVKRLVKKGRLAYSSNHLVQAAGGGGRQTHVTGTFRRTTRGFGFVRPGGVERDRSDDIYIPENRSLDASNGDTVLVQLQRARGHQGKLRGEIVEVVEREKHQFVGTYDVLSGSGLVQVDGGVFGQPVLAGDAGAKNAQTGDKVVIEMVRFPTHVLAGECVITEVLGPRGAPGVDTLSVIREFNLPDEFPETVLEAARGQAESFNESIDSDRVDLTDLTVITIDPQDARDFDDAISLERIERQHWRLGVHIADVSHFVRPQTPLDNEAKDRATSVYLPDRVIPMLPEVISNNLASLQPDRLRYTKTVFIEFTPEGARIGTEPHAAAIRSCRRFTYEEVDDYLAHRSKWKRKLTPEVFTLLGNMYELGMILRARRFQRGALEMSMPETKIDLDQDGRVCGAHLVQHTESHQIIEEFMLAANEAVAELFCGRELLFLRRIHESPAPRKLKALTDFVRELGIESKSLTSRFELQRVLDEVKGLPREQAVNYAVLRSMQKAVYSPRPEGHFALASEHYCHFTSPIRRYPDLTVHRLLDTIFRRRRPAQDMGRLMVEGEHCSEREQRAEQAERELTKLKLLNYLSERIGETLDAVITGVEDFGFFAQGIDLPAEGLIHVNSLRDDRYRFDRTSHSLVGNRRGNSFRLGDTIRVEIARVDLDARKLDLALVDRLAGRPAGRDAKHGKKSRSHGKTADRQATGQQTAQRGKSAGPKEKKVKPKKIKKKKSKGKKNTKKQKTNQSATRKKRRSK